MKKLFDIRLLTFTLFSLLISQKTIISAKETNIIHVFIHVCTINQWEQILERQLNRIITSGLYEASQSIHLGVLGDGSIENFIRKYPKISLLFQNKSLSEYERPTLYHLYDFCTKNHNSLVLYIHTKGVTRYGSPYFSNVSDWTKYMEFFVIDHWKDCITELNNGVDLCGVNFQLYPLPHFSGNFWWGKSYYIATLPNYIEADYLAPEMWVAQNKPVIKSLWQSNINHYDFPYPETIYLEYKNKYSE